MRSRVVALLIAVLTAAGMLAAFTPGAGASSPFPGSAQFLAYANGTKQHVRLVDAQGQTLANVDTSFSGATASSNGLGTAVNNLFNQPVQPPLPGKNSYARSAAAEVSLGATYPVASGIDPAQIKLPEITEAAAAPSTNLIRKDLVGPINADPLLYAAAATDKSQAIWNPNFCPIGQPMSYGENDLADAQLLNTSSTPMPNGLPLVSETPSGDYTTTNFNQSFTYLFGNPDGHTFGVGAVNRQVFAPITVGKGLVPNAQDPTHPHDLINLTLLGTWQLRVEDSGTGAPTVTYAAYDPLGNKMTGPTVVADLIIAGMPVIPLTAQDVFGQNGFSLDIPPGNGPFLAQIHIGNPATPISGRTNAFTADAVRVHLLNVPNTFGLADVAYGHMETQAQAPAGGLDCPIPTSKTFLDANGNTTTQANGGTAFQWKIVFPTADISKELACTLTNVTVTDVASIPADGGKASATLTSASNGGVIGSNTVKPGQNATVTWHLPDYHPGDPPVTLLIGGTLGPNSGKISNTANVSATLGKCTGGAAGQAFVTNGSVGGRATVLNGFAIAGANNVTAIIGPAVAPARLAETGQNQPWLPVVGGGLLLGALGLMRSRRRLLAERA